MTPCVESPASLYHGNALAKGMRHLLLVSGRPNGGQFQIWAQTFFNKVKKSKLKKFDRRRSSSEVLSPCFSRAKTPQSDDKISNTTPLTNINSFIRLITVGQFYLKKSHH